MDASAMGQRNILRGMRTWDTQRSLHSWGKTRAGPGGHEVFPGEGSGVIVGTRRLMFCLRTGEIGVLRCRRKPCVYLS